MSVAVKTLLMGRGFPLCACVSGASWCARIVWVAHGPPPGVVLPREWEAHFAKMSAQFEESLRAMALVMLMSKAKPDTALARDM
jgi:hypothetical protein